MSTIGLPIKLNTSLPFVGTVVQWMDGAASLEDAVAALKAEETRAGLAIHWIEDQEVPPGTFEPRDPTRARSISEVLALVGSWEDFQVKYRPSSKSVSSRFHRFLSLTNLVVLGLDVSDSVLIESPQGVLCSWTMRTWGQEIANWANATGWGPHFSKRGDRYAWDTTDFYTNLSSHHVERFEQWSTAIVGVLKESSRLSLRGLSPSSSEPVRSLAGDERKQQEC